MTTKVKTIRFDEDTPLGKWASNQEDFSKSTRKALDFVIQRFGTGDLFSAIVDEALHKEANMSSYGVKQPQQTQETSYEKPGTEEEVNEVEESTPGIEEEPVKKTTSGLKAKVQSKRSSQSNGTNENGTGERKTRKGINLNMLSD